jgi:competence protein ComEC
VLEVRTGNSALLLTGDITSAVENDVVTTLGTVAPHTVVAVPHHGSKTSSSVAFVNALRPDSAVFSSGYRSRFHHPNPVVVSRYRAIGADLLITPQSGFVDFRFSADAAPRLNERGRIDRHPYWRE